MPILETRCYPPGGAVPPSIPPEGGSAPWPPERGDGSPLPPSYGPGGPGRTSRPVAGLDEPPSCVPQGREGVAPRASRLLACGKSGSFVFAPGGEVCGRERMAHVSARLSAGKNCLFLRLVAGEASPAPPGRGLCHLPSPLRGALPPGPPNGGMDPPYPPLTGRVAPAGRAGPWPGGTSRLLACRKGGGVAPRASRFLAYGKSGCVAARDEPPSCVPQGRGVAPRASQIGRASCRERVLRLV